MTRYGKTTGSVKLRSGPGEQFDPPLTYLEAATVLEILADAGDWLKVQAGGRQGFVVRRYVVETEAPEAPPAEAAPAASQSGPAQAPAASADPPAAPPAAEPGARPKMRVRMNMDPKK